MSEIRDQGLDVVRRRPWALHALGERLDHRVVEARLPAVPGPGLGLRDAAEGRDLLAAPLVERAQVLPAVVERVEIQAVGVAVAVAGVATVPLVERVRRVVEQDLAAPGQRQGLRAAQRDRLDQLGRFGVDDLDGVGEVIRDVEGLAVGCEGQLGRAGRRASTRRYRPSFLSSSGAIRSRELFGPPGKRLQVGPEDHHLVRAAATDGHVPLVAADGHPVGIAGRLALGVERERGIGRRAVERRPASAAGRAPSPGRCCSGWSRTAGSACWRRSPSCRRR